MFGPFGPNILIFVWISTLLLFYVRAYISLSFSPINFKPWNTDPEVSGRCAMPEFLGIFWITMRITVGPMIHMSGEAHE